MLGCAVGCLRSLLTDVLSDAIMNGRSRRPNTLAHRWRTTRQSSACTTACTLRNRQPVAERPARLSHQTGRAAAPGHSGTAGKQAAPNPQRDARLRLRPEEAISWHSPPVTEIPRQDGTPHRSARTRRRNWADARCLCNPAHSGACTRSGSSLCRPAEGSCCPVIGPGQPARRPQSAIVHSVRIEAAVSW